MKDRLLTFVDTLRNAGLSISVAEALDAMHVVATIGVEPQAFREGLAAALVKDEADRPEFDVQFDRFFAAPARPYHKGKQHRSSEAGQGRSTPRATLAPVLSDRPQRQPEEPSHNRAQAREDKPEQVHRERGGAQLARARALRQVPFAEMIPSQIEACDALMTELARRFHAHLDRRYRNARRGKIDIRRTLRKSIGTGGTPIAPAWRHRRPGRPDLVVLCDLSHSVATASKFLLALVVPATAYFRRVRTFAYIDRTVEVSLEDGRLVPHAPLDLYAKSDFGRALAEFHRTYEPLLTRNTMVLILGDARNNRRPPRGDLLGRIHAVVRQTVWLNPESAGRWNTGDSVMATYQRHCDIVLGATNVRDLSLALKQVFSRLL